MDYTGIKNYLTPLTSSFSMRLIRYAAVLTLSIPVILSPGSSQAATDEKGTGARLLQAQLPNGTTIQQADCEMLSRAVGRATVAHRVNAPAIISAALKNGDAQDVLRKEEKRPCECVGRIVRACMKAAPAQASAVLDAAVSIYPDCADALAAILDQSKKDIAYDYKDGRDYKDLAEAPVAGIISRSPSGDPSGVGAGVGPGFPGSPGFGGSSPSGGFALPTPSGVAVTPAVNQ